MKMFLKLLFKFTLNDQRNWKWSFNKAKLLQDDHFQFLWSFNVNLNSNLRNIFMIILYFLDLPVEMLKFWFFTSVNSEEGESRKRSVNIVGWSVT